MLLDKPKGFHAVARLDDRITPGFQKLARHFADVPLVFCEQNGLGTTRRFGIDWCVFKPLDQLIDSRKINLERRTSSQFAVNPDKSATLLDHAVDRSQAQAGAFALRLGGEKWLKNMRLRFQAH